MMIKFLPILVLTLVRIVAGALVLAVMFAAMVLMFSSGAVKP